MMLGCKLFIFVAEHFSLREIEQEQNSFFMSETLKAFVFWYTLTVQGKCAVNLFPKMTSHLLQGSHVLCAWSVLLYCNSPDTTISDTTLHSRSAGNAAWR